MKHGPCFAFVGFFLSDFSCQILWFRSVFSRTLNVYVGISAICCSQIGNAKALPQIAAPRDLTEHGAGPAM